MAGVPRATTESFITEIPLRTTPLQEKRLRARFEAARQAYNACLGESLKRLRRLRQSRLFNRARKMPKGKDRNAVFREAQEAVGFREYDLHHWATRFTRSWINEHIDARSMEAIASRAFDAAEKSMYRVRGDPRFRRFDELNTIEGKIGSGVRWRDTHLAWTGLEIETIIDLTDPVIRHGLEHRIKYVRLTRRIEHGKQRYYAQLVCEGLPYQKPANTVGRAIVGLDLGPSTIAVVAGDTAFLRRFCDELEPIQHETRLIQRALDRSRRKNNPANFNADGTIKKGPKRWHRSARYQRRRQQLAEMKRREAQYRKNLHGRLVNEILRLGKEIKTEKLSYKSFQAQFGKSVGFRAPGMFVERLRRKAGAVNGNVIEFSTRTTKLSQICHGCGQIIKKPLSQRWHKCECGVEAQRDLYSAFLARFVEKNRLNVDQATAAWSGACALLRMALSDLEAANGRSMPSSFGLGKGRRQSGSSVKVGVNVTKAADVVAGASAPSESREEVQGSSTTCRFGYAIHPP